MIQIHQNIEELKKYKDFETEDMEKEAKDTIKEMQLKLIDTSKDVCTDPYKLICFGYEIRKQDYEQ